MIWHMYKLWNDYHSQVNWHINHLTQLPLCVCVCVCVCVIRTHKIYSPGNSQVYNTVLLTIVTMLCIISPELIYLIIKFVLLTSVSAFPPSVSSWNHHFTLCFWVQPFCSPHVSVAKWYLSSSVWLIWLRIMLSRFIHVVANTRISVFLMAEQYNIYIKGLYITLSLSIHPWMDT